MPRRLVTLVSAIVLVDTMFYAVVAPLLPALTDDLHLSKAAAGLLAGAYPAGTLLGSLPSGLLASRTGPRATVLVGLTLLAGSTLVFGFAHDIVLLDLARFVQGLGGACSWAGGLAWLVASAPAERRGELIGTALGWAIGGALFGPVLGALADATAPEVVFSSVVVFAGGLVAWALTMPEAAPVARQGLADVRVALARSDVRIAMWLVTLPALAFGVLGVLGPLRLDHFGFSSAAVAGTYLVAAGVEALVSPFVGRLSDRHGRLAPIRRGLAVAAGLLLLVTVPASGVVLALLLVLLAASFGLFWAPAMALLTDVADATGLALGFAFALVNLAWAAGQVVGSGLGGEAAKLTGDGVPLAVVAAACGVTLAALGRGAVVREVAAAG
ncbi:MFS transporter [Paraconexibacter antarcticus]|uniref:MFS transporter n=1 Tax=Paraconexibacter antarcticus TaxID=2949664 RepID=A0ABY5DQJ9_9ACTN|nr:MFS transporter [Paraconexibacter antarcticus]UTI63181.1 MFS transporter [Paraconexibacter antarcticus]